MWATRKDSFRAIRDSTNLRHFQKGRKLLALHLVAIKFDISKKNFADTPLYRCLKPGARRSLYRPILVRTMIYSEIRSAEATPILLEEIGSLSSPEIRIRGIRLIVFYGGYLVDNGILPHTMLSAKRPLYSSWPEDDDRSFPVRNLPAPIIRGNLRNLV